MICKSSDHKKHSAQGMSEMMCPVLLVVLAVLLVILAAAVGVKLSEAKRNIMIDESLSALKEGVKKSSAVVQEIFGAKTAGESTEADAGDEEAGKPAANAGDEEAEKPAADAGDEEAEKPAADKENGNHRGKDQFTAADYPEDEEIRKVLMTYQEYIDENETYFDGYLLAYLDEDDIPELIAIGNCEAAGQMIITYREGELLENQIGRLGGLRYAKKQNFYYNSNGNMGHYYDEF